MKRFILICWDGIFKMLEKSPLRVSCLACFASALVSMLARRPIWIFYFRNHWFRRDGGLVMQLGRTLKLRRHSVKQWRLAGEEMFSFRRPWWFSRYRPKADDFISRYRCMHVRGHLSLFKSSRKPWDSGGCKATPGHFFCSAFSFDFEQHFKCDTNFFRRHGRGGLYQVVLACR